MMWLRFMYEMDNLTPANAPPLSGCGKFQFAKVVNDGAIFSQPISRRWGQLDIEPIKTNCRKVDGGWVINGSKFLSLAGNCDYYSIVCT